MIPEEIENKLIWLFLILPGFLSLSIIGQIVDLGQLSEFQFVYYSFVLTLCNLFVTLLIWWPIWKISRKRTSRNIPFFITVIIISIVGGLICGFAAEKDWFFLSLRSLPITDTLNKRSSSRPYVFLLSRNSAGLLKEEGDARPKSMKVTEAWVKVKMKNGDTYEGWPEFYEIGKNKSELYLSPACEWEKEYISSKIKQIPGPGILIFEDEITSITFVDRKESECFKTWPY